MKKLLLLVSAITIAIGTTKAQSVIFSENFETTVGTAIPTTWTQSTASSDGGWLSGTALASTYFPIPAHTRYLATNDDNCNCDKSKDSLKTFSVSFAGTTHPFLTFDIFFLNSENGGLAPPQEVGTVIVSTNNGVTWTTVNTLSGAGSWVNDTISLTAYAGMSNVRLGFVYNDGGGWAWGMAIDNVKVTEPLNKDLNVTRIDMSRYMTPGSQTVTTDIQNLGGANITSATLNYSIDGGTPVTQVFSPAIAFNARYSAVFTTPASLTTVGLHQIKSWVSDVNTTGVDTDPSNDTTYLNVTVEATAPVHNVLAEEFTGSWCGYCPMGEVSMEEVIASDPKVIWAAMHTGDNMQITGADTVENYYDGGDPQCAVDRSYIPSEGAWALQGLLNSTNRFDPSFFPIREAVVVPATVSLTGVNFNSSSRLITATVNANFVGDVKGNYALNCYLIEDRVYGPLTDQTDNGWNQHSYWYEDNTTPYYNTGDTTTTGWSGGASGVAGLMPISYQHMHVLETMMGGAWGDRSAIPITLVTAGTNLSHTFTYTLPAANPSGAHQFNDNNCYIIGILQEYSTLGDLYNSHILNVVQQKLTTAPETGLSMTGVEQLSNDFGTFAIYPNPASTSTNIAMSLNSGENVVVNVYNALGALVYSENNGKLSAGEHLININTERFANGIYNVTISTNKGLITKKVVISK